MRNILRSCASFALLINSVTMAEAKIVYRGGNGSSTAQAIIIQGAKGEMDGIASEYQWIRGNRVGWRTGIQSLFSRGKKQYDVLTIRKGGKSEDIYFDITGFYGKMRR